MLILAIDTAAGATTVAVGRGATVLASIEERDARRHAEVLAPALERVCSDAGVSLGELTHIVCGVGPGPFTGLRVGVATARTLGLALGIPVAGVCTLDVVARATGYPCTVTTDARRKEVYWASYDVDGTRIRGPLVNTLERVRELVDESTLHDPVTAVDPSALIAFAAGALAEGTMPTVDIHYAVDEPSGDGEATADRIHGGVLLSPVPLYLRRPDAEPQAAK